MPVLQHVDVVNSTPFHLPLDLAVLLHDGQLAIALQGNPVSGLGRADQQDNQGHDRQQANKSTHQMLHEFEMPSIVADAIGYWTLPRLTSQIAPIASTKKPRRSHGFAVETPVC